MAITPIVLIHQGDNDYLFRTLYMLNRFYKPSEIFLIGNNANKHYSNYCTHFSVADLKTETTQISKAFFNLSSNGADFELFCIERWFILSAFLKRQKLIKAIYLDTDILIYESLEAYCTKFKGYGMTMIGVSGHTNFVLKPEVLEKFCAWILNLYSSNEGKETINQWYQEHLTKHKLGGISDMTFFTKYQLANPAELVNLEGISAEFNFDRSFSESNGFETEVNGMKKLYWTGNTPQIKHLESGKLVNAVTLHFQGIGKPFLLTNVKPKTLSFSLTDFYFQKRLFLSKVFKKLLK